MRSRLGAVVDSYRQEHPASARNASVPRHKKFLDSNAGSNCAKTMFKQNGCSPHGKTMLLVVLSSVKREHSNPGRNTRVLRPTRFSDGSSSYSCVKTYFFGNETFPNRKRRLRTRTGSSGRAYSDPGRSSHVTRATTFSERSCGPVASKQIFDCKVTFLNGSTRFQP